MAGFQVSVGRSLDAADLVSQICQGRPLGVFEEATGGTGIRLGRVGEESGLCR
jgi:hypothetical protein